MIVSAYACAGTSRLRAQQPDTVPYAFNHGPYLQEVMANRATFVFTTSEKGFSWVEVKTQNGEPQTYYDFQDGLLNAYNTFNAIRVEGLKPATKYYYRLISKEIVDFQPYKVTFGDSIVSPWWSFQTLDPYKTKHSILAVSDIHADNKKLKTLLANADINSAEMVFYVGDMQSHFDKEDAPWVNFLDTSVEIFAKEKPFVLVRGNHETRGNKAREYYRYVPNKSGKFYGTYLVGNTMFVVLDGGEDKPDTEPVYAGLIDFDKYRTQQAEWLGEVIKSDEFKNARFRIVMSHFPPDYDENAWHGVTEIAQKIIPILNEADIDLMIAGHTHRFSKMEPAEGRNNFPIVVGSNKSISRIDIDGDTLKIKVIDTDNKVLLDETFKK
jgi:predicted phosphodiesterase